MPYVKQSERERLDKVVEEMVKQGVKPNGDINYILFKFFKDNSPRSYNDIKGYIAELTECGEEIRRRFLVPYEDKKIEDNGDV